jgi:hypothetical protein
VDWVAAQVVAQQRYLLQGVLLVDRVVIYSPDQEALLVTAYQALAVQAVVQEVTAHTTAMTVVDPLMGQAVAAVGARRGAATAYQAPLAVLAARELKQTAIVLH